MRVLNLIAFLAVLVTAVLAWTKEDHEIFDLVSALQKAEGKGTSFYSWLDVSPSASTPEISKAYRKKSLQLHPDKNKGVKNAHERFARLGVIAAILRDSAKRERYDFFYKNGVPVWRGTGYYYSRFRPGLGTVLVFLILATSGVQYLVQKMNYNRDLKRIEELVGQARQAAWGAKLNPVEGQRKVKVSLGGGARMDEDGNVLPGRMVDMIVEGSHVYILEPNGSMIPLDRDTAVAPSFKRTWFLSLVTGLLGKVTGRDGSTIEPTTSSETDGGEESDEASGLGSDGGSGTVTPREESGPGKAKMGRAAATTIAGGRRRKGVASRKK
ncbi:DnaJ-domain-containing protein [Daedaleopsis nitida]|nr:DnaJ-domain-containing protein [Daedaleopsis nitida]